MDLGGEALGAFKAKQGGCTQIQVSPCPSGTPDQTPMCSTPVRSSSTKRREISSKRFFQTKGMEAENRNRKMHQSRMWHGILQGKSPRQCLHPNPRSAGLMRQGTLRIRFLDSTGSKTWCHFHYLSMDGSHNVYIHTNHTIDTDPIHNHDGMFRCDHAY